MHVLTFHYVLAQTRDAEAPHESLAEVGSSTCFNRKYVELGIT